MATETRRRTKTEDAAPGEASKEREQFRWNLALDIRRRVDNSATLLRALLLALAGGIAAYVSGWPVSPNWTLRGLQIASLAAAGLAVATIVVSWFRQKAKSHIRQDILVRQGLDAYLAHEREIENHPRKFSNEFIDGIACAFLALAALAAVLNLVLA